MMYVYAKNRFSSEPARPVLRFIEDCNVSLTTHFVVVVSGVGKYFIGKFVAAWCFRCNVH